MVKYTLKEKILKFLIENKESPHSIMEISKKLKTDYKNTSQALSKINPKTYLKSKQGNSYLIEFNQNNNIETLSIEEKRTEEFFSKNLNLKVIRKYIKELNFNIPNPKTFFLLSKNISNYKINIDIKSSQIKQNIIEVLTTLHLHPINNSFDKIDTKIV